MDVVRYLSLSQDLTQAQLPKGAINGIRVDNPSGSWLLVEPLHVYVPPYRNGWSMPLQNVLAVTVRWVDSPSGSKSQVVMPIASKVMVYLTDQQVPADPGVPSGAGAAVTTVPDMLVVSANLACQYIIDVPILTDIIAADPTNKYIIRRLVTSFTVPAWAQALATSVWFLGAELNWQQSVDMETPSTSEVFEEGALTVAAGDALRCQALIDNQWVAPDGTSDNITVQVQYYPVAV